MVSKGNSFNKIANPFTSSAVFSGITNYIDNKLVLGPIVTEINNEVPYNKIFAPLSSSKVVYYQLSNNEIYAPIYSGPHTFIVNEIFNFRINSSIDLVVNFSIDNEIISEINNIEIFDLVVIFPEEINSSINPELKVKIHDQRVIPGLIINKTVESDKGKYIYPGGFIFDLNITHPEVNVITNGLQVIISKLINKLVEEEITWAYLNTPINNGDIWTIVNSNMDSYHIFWASSTHFSMWTILESYSSSQIDGYSVISINFAIELV